MASTVTATTTASEISHPKMNVAPLTTPRLEGSTTKKAVRGQRIERDGQADQQQVKDHTNPSGQLRIGITTPSDTRHTSVLPPKEGQLWEISPLIGAAPSGANGTRFGRHGGR